MLVSGVDPAGPPVPRQGHCRYLHIGALQRESPRRKTGSSIGTGINLGRLAREAVGENGLIRQAASLIANPLVRNRITLLQALDPESPYFDITTPLVLLDAKVRLQSPTAKRTISIREFLEACVTRDSRKAKSRLPSNSRSSRLAIVWVSSGLRAWAERDRCPRQLE